MKKRKRQKPIPGDIVSIKFDNSFHTYGRVLNFGDLAIYDCKSTEEKDDLQEIIASKVILKVIVNIGGVEMGRWPIIGNVPLEISLQQSKYYVEEVGSSKKYQICDNGTYYYGLDESACIGIPYGGIWDPAHIEQILIDYYNRIDSEILKRNDVLGTYKMMWGIQR